MKKIFFVLFTIILNASFAYGGVVSGNIQNGCNFLTNTTRLVAVFEQEEYNCANGEFLPADSLACISCPTGYTCSGGTFHFNEYFAQGIVYNQLVTSNVSNACGHGIGGRMIAVFEPAVYECSPGYYLPAGVDECTECLNDSWCPGGTYTFNETTNQGINSCPNEHPHAPQGMWLASQCGRRFHMSDGSYHDILYLHQQPANPTTHGFKIIYGENNTLYSANAVLRDTTPNASVPKVSAGATHAFHAMIKDIVNGVEVEREYLFCDDSVPECRNIQ